MKDKRAQPHRLNNKIKQFSQEIHKVTKSQTVTGIICAQTGTPLLPEYINLPLVTVTLFVSVYRAPILVLSQLKHEN